MIRNRVISAEELLELDLVARYNSRINTIIQIDEAAARASARNADAALRRGSLMGPLHGVAMTVKEFFDQSACQLHGTSNRCAITIRRTAADGRAAALGRGGRVRQDQ